MTTKISREALCSECKEIRPYYARKLCKQCYHRWAYRGLPRRREQSNKASLRWQKENPERARENRRRWAKDNLELTCERTRQWRSSNPEKARECWSRWSKDNPESIRAKVNRRRAREAGGGGSHTAAERKLKFAVFGNRCIYCGVSGKLTEDHDMPVARGGSDNISNILPACLSCNSRKGKRTAKEFIELLAKEKQNVRA